MPATSKSHPGPSPAPDPALPVSSAPSEHAELPSDDAAAPSQRSRVRARVARRPDVPSVVVWITGLYLALLMLYSVALPTYRAPDEPHHVDLAHLFSEELRYPAWDDRDIGSGIHRSLSFVNFGSRAQHLTAEAAPPKGQRPAIEDLEDPPVPTSINQISGHPPLYYVATGTATWIIEAVGRDPIGDFMLETWFYRALSALLVASLPLVIWRVARHLRLPSTIMVAAMLLPLAIPQFLHIGASANNDNLVLPFIWMLTPVVVRVADGALEPRTAALAGSLTGLAFLTKITAMVMPLWVAGALGVALWRRRRDGGVGQVMRFGLTYGGVSLVVGGWWWVRNVVLYGDVMPTRFSQLLPPNPDTSRNLWTYVHSWAYATTRRFWGDFGWYDTHVSGVVIAIATAFTLTGLVVACTRRDRVAGTPLVSRLVLAAPFIVLVVAQFNNSLRGYIATGRMAGLQGRYWFGALAGLAVVVSLGFANLAGRRHRLVPVALLMAVTAMQVAAMSAIFGFYWGEPGDSLPNRVRAIVAWAPLPGELLAVGAALGTVVTVGALAQIATTVAREMGPVDPIRESLTTAT